MEKEKLEEWLPFKVYDEPIYVLFEGELAVYIPGFEIKPIKIKRKYKCGCRAKIQIGMGAFAFCGDDYYGSPILCESCK